ncbi:MAG: LamG-like jellyroll fold domain-containing protein [Euryarchaeota archaeon]|nr:LamG-like jellyroll fold domain-containing protein [Euryarchaeota archaeon]
MIALFGLPASVQAEEADDGLVAEWHFDEGSGSVLADSSGNGNDGVIHSATWVEGKYGTALSFDGVDDKVKLPYSVINGLTDVTSEFWIKTTDDCAGILTGANSVRDNEYLIYWNYATETHPHIKQHIKDEIHIIPINIITDDNWHHITVVREISKVSVYVDGTFKGLWTNAPTGILAIDPSGLWIGGEQDSVGGGWDANQQFNGVIDEVRIYNRALTADEIKSHYEGKQTALSLTKSASPHSTKQGQTTTMTLTVTNTGTTEITDIEVLDTTPSDLIFIDGETSKTYTSLKPKDSREFQYVLQPSDVGTFNLDPATATYADEEGNYHTIESNTVAITAIQSMDQPTAARTAPKPSTKISTASVHLHGEKTDVVMGEDVLLKLSAVNKITKPTMTLQVILIPPSGMSVTSADFVDSGAGLYTSTYVIEPGVGRDIEVGIRSNQVGNFVVNGEVIYYFGDDKENAEEHLLSLPITVWASPDSQQETPASTATPKNRRRIPGFGAVVAAAGLLCVALLIKRRRVD